MMQQCAFQSLSCSLHTSVYTMQDGCSNYTVCQSFLTCIVRASSCKFDLVMLSVCLGITPVVVSGEKIYPFPARETRLSLPPLGGTVHEAKI